MGLHTISFTFSAEPLAPPVTLSPPRAPSTTAITVILPQPYQIRNGELL